ncbi:MAG: HAD family phosphatase [Sneathiella sp.]
MRDAVIFDMDGLLLDTERLSLKAYQETCANFDIAYEETFYFSLIGRSLKQAEQILINTIPNFPTDPFMTFWNNRYHEEALEKPVPLKAGVLSFLTLLKDRNIPCAVATSTEFDKATRKLSNAGLLDFFQEMAAGDQVEQSKPHPEIYRLAASRLGISPAQCLALEDSDNGVRAAHAANMLVYQIPDLVPPSEDVKRLGHFIVPTLQHVEKLFAS